MNLTLPRTTLRWTLLLAALPGCSALAAPTRDLEPRDILWIARSYVVEVSMTEEFALSGDNSQRNAFGEKAQWVEAGSAARSFSARLEPVGEPHERRFRFRLPEAQLATLDAERPIEIWIASSPQSTRFRLFEQRPEPRFDRAFGEPCPVDDVQSRTELGRKLRRGRQR